MANNLYIRTHGDTFKLVGPHQTPDLARQRGMEIAGYGNYYLENETGSRRTKQRTKQTLAASKISSEELNRLFHQL